MSSTSLGLPLAFGQTLRPSTSTYVPPHCTAGPDNFTLSWNTNNNLIIYAIKNTDNEMLEKGKEVKGDLFALVKPRSIDSNISWGNIIDGSTVIQNAEINLYATLNGRVDLEGVAFAKTGEDKLSELNAMIISMSNYWFWKIKKEFDIDLNFYNIDEILMTTTSRILKETYKSFIEINSTYTAFDLSVYSNVIISSFASMAQIFTAYYNNYIRITNSIKNNDYIDELIATTNFTIDTKLKQIDSTFYSYQFAYPALMQYLKSMTDNIFKILTDQSSEDNFFKAIVNINNQVKIHKGIKYDISDFNNYMLGKFGALIGLAYLMECLSITTIAPTAKSSLFFLFALPQKFLYN